MQKEDIVSQKPHPSPLWDVIHTVIERGEQCGANHGQYEDTLHDGQKVDNFELNLNFIVLFLYYFITIDKQNLLS